MLSPLGIGTVHIADGLLTALGQSRKGQGKTSPWSVNGLTIHRHLDDLGETNAPGVQCQYRCLDALILNSVIRSALSYRAGPKFQVRL